MGKDVNNIASYDVQSDSLYIFAKPGREERILELVPGVNLELDRKGQVIGIEILRASRFLRKIKSPTSKIAYEVREPLSPYTARHKTRRK